MPWSIRVSQIFAWLFLLSLEVGAIWLTLHPEFGYSVQGFILSLILLWLMFYIGILLLPGQGNLILSSEGFEVASSLKSYRRKYRWIDVTGFYLGTVTTHHQVNQVLCFDKVGWSTSQRKQTILFRYEGYSLEDLAALLNQYKERYGPNPEGVVFDPVPDSPFITPDYQKRSQVGIFISFAFLLVLFGFIGYSLLSSKYILLVNNTHERIENIDAVTYSYSPKNAHAFHIAPLDPEREASVNIVPFDKGDIRVSYNGAQPACAYVSHTQCQWTRGDTIYLEPHGKIVARASMCGKKLDQMRIRHCAEKDAQIDALGFSYILSTGVRPNGKPRVTSTVSTRVGLQALKMEVSRHWHPPATEQHLQAIVHFELLENATIQNVIMLKSSENQLWDQRALDALHDASPEKMMPENKSLLPASVNFNFEYPPH